MITVGSHLGRPRWNSISRSRSRFSWNEQPCSSIAPRSIADSSCVLRVFLPLYPRFPLLFLVLSPLSSVSASKRHLFSHPLEFLCLSPLFPSSFLEALLRCSRFFGLCLPDIRIRAPSPCSPPFFYPGPELRLSVLDRCFLPCWRRVVVVVVVLIVNTGGNSSKKFEIRVLSNCTDIFVPIVRIVVCGQLDSENGSGGSTRMWLRWWLSAPLRRKETVMKWFEEFGRRVIVVGSTI